MWEKEREVCNMQVVLENEALKVTINSFGAELASIRGKATDTEYLWNADAKLEENCPGTVPLCRKSEK